MINSRAIRLMAALAVLASTAGCDHATKQLARSELGRLGSSKWPGGILELTLTENSGAFLSLGASLPGSARAFLAAVIGLGLAGLLIYLLRATTLRWGSFAGLVLIWAGGLSNLLERFVRHGLVTDFMLIRVGPLHTGVFNVADLAIVSGMIILLASVGAGPRTLKSGALP
jgi:signal peptidase II